jgi:DNA modification methylase
MVIDIESRNAEALAALATGTYADVAAKYNMSRGKLYSLALRAGARKHEQRIAEKKAERQARQREFLEQAMNATHKADVLDYLAALPDASIAMHLTSPPYNINRAYSAGSDSYAFSFYLGWLMQVLSEVARTLEEGGVAFIQVGSTRGPDGHLLPLDIALFSHLQTMGLTFQSRIAWIIPHGLTPSRRVSERYETALVFTKGPVPRVFNPTPCRTPQAQPGKRSYKGPAKGQLSGHAYGAHPSNVWAISNCGANRGGRVADHPAQMPVDLARRAVLLYTMPGDHVVDAFMGSGTTAQACIELGRSFSGCDIGYEDLRRERLARVSPDLVTMLPGVTDESLAVWHAEAKVVRHEAPVQQALLKLA